MLEILEDTPTHDSKNLSNPRMFSWTKKIPGPKKATSPKYCDEVQKTSHSKAVMYDQTISCNIFETLEETVTQMTTNFSFFSDGSVQCISRQ